MHPWVPRPVDPAAAAVFTAGTQAEVWTGVVGGAPRPLLAATYLVGTAAAAWHRIAPVSALAVVLTALAVVPGAFGVDPSAGLAWFVTAFAVIVSAGYHARRPLGALVVTLGLLAASIVVDKGVVVADIAYAWLLAGGGWLAGRAVANRTARADLSEERAALAEQEAQWRAAAAVADERLRIAREMHDVVAHGISVMTLHAGGVRRLLRPDRSRSGQRWRASSAPGGSRWPRCTGCSACCARRIPASPRLPPGSPGSASSSTRPAPWVCAPSSQ